MKDLILQLVYLLNFAKGIYLNIIQCQMYNSYRRISPNIILYFSLIDSYQFRFVANTNAVEFLED